MILTYLYSLSFNRYYFIFLSWAIMTVKGLNYWPWERQGLDY